MKFKAAILLGKRSVEIDYIKLSEPLSSGQVLVKMNTSGVCGKQLEEYTQKMGNDVFLPHLFGHEGFGEVVETHNSVTSVKVGDEVVAHWRKGVGINSATPNYKRGEQKINAGWITTFSEYSIISENRLTKIDYGANPHWAALLGCAATTGIGAVINEAQVKPYHDVLVVGAGGVGSFVIAASKLVHANTLDVLCLKLNPIIEKLISSVNGEFFTNKNKITKKYDHVFVTPGSAKALEAGFEFCRDGGLLSVIGVPSPDDISNLKTLDLHRNRRINGSSGGNIEPERDIARYYKFFKDNLISPDDFIDGVYKIEDLPSILNKLENGLINGRALISFQN